MKRSTLQTQKYTAKIDEKSHKNETKFTEIQSQKIATELENDNTFFLKNESLKLWPKRVALSITTKINLFRHYVWSWA